MGSSTCGVVVEPGGRACGRDASGAAMRQVAVESSCDNPGCNTRTVWITYCRRHAPLFR